MISFDAYTTEASSGTGNQSFSHAQGNCPNGLIVVFASVENGSNNHNAATYNSVAMRAVATDGNNAGPNGSYLKLWELHGTDVPAAGSYTVAVTYNAFDGSANSRIAGVMTFKNVRSQNEEATGTSNANGTNPLTASVTTVTPNALVVIGYSSQNGDPNATSNTSDTIVVNRHMDAGEDSTLSMGYKIVATPGANSISWNVNNPESEAMVSAAFQEAPPTGGYVFQSY